MKMSHVKNAASKIAFPMVVCGMLLTGSGAMAQAGVGDICSVHPNGTYAVPLRTSGETVSFSIRLFSLYGNFTRQYLGGLDPVVADVISPFEIRVVTGSGLAYARLTGINNLTTTPPYRTDLRFQYTVKAGDLAFPMRVYGSAGTGILSGDPYQFNDGQWRVYNPVTTSNAVWRYTAEVNWNSGLGDVFDPTLENANIRLQTLKFETDAWTVPQTRTIVCTVSTDEAVSNNVPFYVWSADTNIAQIVEQQPGESSTPLAINKGLQQTTFRIKGVAMGSTEIYLSPASGLTPGLTNYIKKAVTVSDPPPPTASVVLSSGLDANGLMQVSLDETDTNVNTLKVVLSEPYTTNVTVSLVTDPAVQQKLQFLTDPTNIQIAQGATESAWISYRVRDGLSSVTISPTFSLPAAANTFYSIKESATVNIRNVKPVLVRPVSTDVLEVYRLTPYTFDWEISDVAADATNGMKVVWHFGETGVTNRWGNGAVGTISYTFMTAGIKTVKVQAIDKDGGSSDPVYFTVDVKEPQPRPKARVVTSSRVYSETDVKNAGEYFFTLSEPFPSDVTIGLVTDSLATQSLVFAHSNPVTIPAGQTNSAASVIKFSMPDGTVDTEGGMVLTPVVLGDVAAAEYFGVDALWVYVTNAPPVVDRLMGQKVVGNTISNAVSIPANVNTEFSCNIKDVAPDLGSIRTYWDFGDNTGTFTATSVPGSTNTVRVATMHKYAIPGTYTALMWAEDKDGGRSQEVQFTVVVQQAPTVTVLTPSGALSENQNVGALDYVIVQLSSAFTNPVTVNLTVTPVTNAVNGFMSLGQYTVTFPAGTIGQTVEQQVTIGSIKDGTDVSQSAGFTITPSVVATAAAQAFYTNNLVSGVVRIYNESPVLTTDPPESPITGTDVAAIITQDAEHLFYWNVKDVRGDLSTMSVTWYFGNRTVTRTGASGVVTNIFDSTGDKIIRVVATDKDGAFDEVYFKIRVQLSKAVNVTPVGPVLGGAYASAAGLGNGLVFAGTAEKRIIEQNVFFFKFHPEVTSADLVAVPYKTGTPGGSYMLTNYINRVLGIPGQTAFGTPAGQRYYDSFFYVWVGADQGLPVEALVPVASPSVTVTLPAAQAGGAGSVDTRNIQAVFSREWHPTDNLGDINNDGIPDLIAIRYGLPALLGSDLADARGYNDDQDFLPGSASDGTGMIAGLTNVWSAVGTPFTAFLEVRGYHEGLNSTTYGSDRYWGPGEEEAFLLTGVMPERPTDPTKLDTDGDGYPDGWEYYFWYNALVRHMSGERYNPQDVAQGIEIPWNEIYAKFDPLIPSADLYGERDTDGDGLTDFEELATGTNPIHWDTDGDGMCDGWEILRGLNPSDPRDGLDPARNNPDGDHMAISVVSRDFVTDDAGSTYLRASDGSLSTWYHYGNTNAPVALGRPVTLPAGRNIDEALTVVTNVLVLHFQVFHEFGFDPRTAWVGSVGRVPTWVRNTPVPEGWADMVASSASFARFPAWAGSDAANTRPFTSLDEYLLMKFMSENRVGGAGASIGAGNAANKTLEWSRWSTHPLTPDTDATAALADGVPDGWELYVSCAPGTRAMSISPWSAEDFDDDVETPAPLGDGLTVQREFAGVDSCAAYANPALYGAGLATVTITRPAIDALWLNKFWPTNPWSKDTDGDGLNDGAERAFMYGTPTDDGSTCIVGGGLNPNSVDTDLDGLPDAWENEFGAPVNRVSGGVTNVVAGMDGTVNDARNDNDQDGLLNYQEYWVQAMRHFRYDIPDVGVTGPVTGNSGLPMDMSFQPYMLFTPVNNAWDVAQYPWGDANPQLWFMPPVGPARRYVSTDPRDHDTDQDGMDDYYELFHGLNPILGNGILASGLDDRVGRAYIDQGAWTIDWGTMLLGNDWGAGLPRDFVTYPWLAGMPDSDPDADGLLNVEEALLVNTAAPAHSNTDPTPLWMTDSGFFPAPGTYSPMSFTTRFYGPGTPTTPMFFWPGSAPIPDDYMMYTFEMNEGYDTDNDGVSDKAELVSGPSGNSDPQDHDSPARRQALWFDGAQSAAQNFLGNFYGADGLQSFTIELWAKPEAIKATEQVLLERVFLYGQSDLGTPLVRPRRNFRVGIDANTGRIFAMFQNAGGHDDHTGVVYAYGRVIVPGEWVHIAARMDGNAGVFMLLINGETAATVNTTLLPANGVISVAMDPASPDSPSYTVFSSGVIVAGAANDDPVTLPQSWGTFHSFYQGWIDEVRIWDGARATADIQSDVRKRYRREDLLANRAAVIADLGTGASRVIGNPRQLIPELLYHYTFDNLFSSHNAASVATVPRGFNDPAVGVNRPFSFIFWWGALMGGVNSQVYTDYGYVPWIENGVEHLPRVDGTVQNSVFWSENGAGSYTGQSNLFPNSGDPYGMIYRTSPTPPLATVEIKSDLLPLGMAWAKQSDDMWDQHGPSGNWADASVDTDSDGLPDWWEILHGLDPTVGGITADGWNGLFPGGGGMTNGERYLRDLAAGWRDGDTIGSGPTGPVQTADSDGDGMPDWWESLYNLNPFSAEGKDGAGGDPDLDGLSNYAEYLISEKHGNLFGNLILRPNQIRTDPDQTVSDYFLKPGGSQLYLGQMFSDHDFMEDAWEDRYPLTYINRYVYDAHIDSDDDGWSNWAECRYSAAGVNVRPDRIMSTGLNGVMNYEFPIPLIETSIRYNGIKGDGALVVHAYSGAVSNGQPNAVFRLPAGATGVAKTYMVGDWKPKTVNGVLSPGGVQPGTITYTFTDSWTGLSMPTGFDRDGKLYSGNVAGDYTEIGTIDYATGEFSLDLNYYAGSWIVPAGNPATLTRSQYVDVEISSVVIGYTARPITGWPKQVYLGRADTGYIREGTNHFFVFMDLDNNGTWSAGEPCGVSAPFSTEIGWHRNRISVELTDYTPGYLRMDLLANLRSEDIYFGTGGTGGTGGTTTTGGGSVKRVRVQRRLVDGLSSWRKVVVDRVLDSSFPYLHEGFVLQQGQYALDWGMVEVTAGQAKNTVVYEVYVDDDRVDANLTGGATYVFTNTFDTVRAKASDLLPSGGYVYSARPTFKWKMPSGYNAFTLEIRQAASTAGTLVYSSGTMQVPPRDSQGYCVWEAPISANDRLATGVTFDANKVYYWRVIAMNAKFSTAVVADTQWSDFKSFRLNVNDPTQAGYGSVNARVKYHGPAGVLANRVKVQVFANAGFSGLPLAEYTVKAADLASVSSMAAPVVNAKIGGLAVNSAHRPYYIRAFIDSNQNGRRDVWESWGYANYYGITESMFDPRPVIVRDSTNPETYDIVIEDADTDQDWFPDAWEYEQNPGAANFLDLIGPATNGKPNNEVNPLLETAGRSAAGFVMALTFGSTDSDGDGLDDLSELLLGSDVQSASTSGDGFSDGDKVALGLAPADVLSLSLTGFGKGVDAQALVQWSVGLQTADGVNRSAVQALSTASSGVKTYQILYSPSLANPEWICVKTGTVELSGVQTLVSEVEASVGVDPLKGFFRVRLVP